MEIQTQRLLSSSHKPASSEDRKCSNGFLLGHKNNSSVPFSSRFDEGDGEDCKDHKVHYLLSWQYGEDMNVSDMSFKPMKNTPVFLVMSGKEYY